LAASGSTQIYQSRASEGINLKRNMPPQRVVEERGDFARNRILSERRRPVVQETVVQETVVQETANWRLHRALAAWLVAALFAAGARAA
jgi:hypothetical protein